MKLELDVVVTIFNDFLFGGMGWCRLFEDLLKIQMTFGLETFRLNPKSVCRRDMSGALREGGFS